MVLYRNARGLAKPARPHTLTASAESARAAVRADAQRRRRDREAKPIVTRHQAPIMSPLPKSAADLIAAAERAGFDVKSAPGRGTVNVGRSNERVGPAWAVAGYHEGRRLGFHCTWVNGKASIGKWWSAADRMHGEHVGVGEVKRRITELGR